MRWEAAGWGGGGFGQELAERRLSALGVGVIGDSLLGFPPRKLQRLAGQRASIALTIWRSGPS